VKTIIELPDAVHKKAKARARAKGVALNVFLKDTLVAQIDTPEQPTSAKPWMHIFDDLKRDSAFHAEIQRINDVIEAEYENVEPENAR